MPFVKGQSGNKAGRPRGSRSRTRILLEQRMLDQLQRLHLDLAQQSTTAHGVLVAIYTHPDTSPEMRMEAAKIAVRYETPALIASHVSGSVDVNLSYSERLTNARKRLESYAGPVIDMLPASAREVTLSCTETSS